jgi:SNF2 family DNA or RNA helicase
VPIHAGTDPNAAVRLRSMTGPFILRRLKTDKSIISDLPEKMEMKTYCTLTKEQASLYASVLKDIEDRIGSSDGIERKGLILATLSKLKQVCNHPAHFLGDNSSVPGRSGKVTRLSEMVEEIIDAGEKALVFTQFAEMGGILKKHLQETFGREIFFLHGAVPIKQRSQMVDRFQNERNASPVFILSLKAGGTGLNLTQVENQATDRAFRIGQTKNVHVYKFICAGTLEDKIDEMIERKKGIADKIVGAGEGWLTELSNKELKELFMLSKDMVGE